MKLNQALKNYITLSSDILGGIPVFKNTRVPVKILFDYLKNGENINEFLDNYPTVKPDFVTKIIEVVATRFTKIDNNESVA